MRRGRPSLAEAHDARLATANEDQLAGSLAGVARPGPGGGCPSRARRRRRWRPARLASGVVVGGGLPALRAQRRLSISFGGGLAEAHHARPATANEDKM